MTNIKDFFPNSFTDYLGKRKAIVTLQGHYKLKDVQSLCKGVLGMPYHLNYKGEQGSVNTIFEVTLLSIQEPFY